MNNYNNKRNKSFKPTSKSYKTENKPSFVKDKEPVKVSNEVMIWGKNSVMDALQSNLNFSKLLVAEGNKNLELPTPKSLNIQYLAKEELDKLSSNANHQGYILIVKSVNYSDISFLVKRKPELVLALDHIVDPQNLGAIIRTANAAGIKDIIIPKDNAADVNSVALKVASGGFVGMNFYKVSSLSATLSKLKNNSYWVYSTTLSPDSVDYTKVSYATPTVIVMGNEGSGISKSVVSVSDQLIHINQYGSVQSLNVSVATGIVLFGVLNSKLK
ncbi:23S rRNA (guanosine(2251)-2'-O)-methyltransferase RlmB [Mycoplasma seminis]|uniref:23S rRNA (Guanosine(2251)-2'-O)-methyltransferase RlmB n=1 Tax=Mycoplasma seminis TaxID=512749 RepID=A0ABY9HAQ5_9MOLU|nr:23S rRNA (guanosine(2251)-2'-O)-methyltransferase RlmB [Mycoplasma seminis]WLP85688.1 23S rRNA (guanosine(2251)-2'-O)-methyltransferase RlmB [Mycoplasma seminis]